MCHFQRDIFKTVRMILHSLSLSFAFAMIMKAHVDAMLLEDWTLSYLREDSLLVALMAYCVKAILALFVTTA